MLLTVLLPNLGTAGGADYGQAAWRIGKAFVLLVPVLFLAWRIVPRLLARVEKRITAELSVLLVLTICLVAAAITEAVGLSLALGAFIGGLLLGSSDYAHSLAAKSFPIRDAFVALFFVTIGQGSLIREPAPVASLMRNTCR